MRGYLLLRKGRRSALLIGAVGAVIAGLGATAGVAPAAAVGTVTMAANSAHSLLVDPAARAIAAQQHVSLAQAQTRLSWQAAVPTLNALLSRRLPAADLGGIWIAPDDGDRIKVGAVGSNPHVFATITRAVRAAGLAAATDLVAVKYSAQQLVRADAWLSAQLTRLPGARSRSFHLDVSYRTDLNRVQLGVAGNRLTVAERALVARARARYGDLVQVVSQPAGTAMATSLDCTFPYCMPPLRGGIWIRSTNSAGATDQCTGAFIARSRTDGKLYQFTAGHCVAAANFTGTWSTKFPDKSWHAIGAVHHYIFGSGGDMALLNINNPSGWRLPQGWVYVTAGPNTTLNERYPISSAQSSTVGARICESGAISGSICGVVVSLGHSVHQCPGPGVCAVVKNLGEASFCGAEGDSGGPVFAAHQAFGLVSAEASDLINGYDCVTYYQGIKGADNAMNVDIVLAVPPGPPNPDPSGLTAAGVIGGVKLTWQDNSRNETAWIISDGVTNRYLNVANGYTTGPVSFTWTGMGSHQRKCLHVRAYNAYGTSGYTPPSGYVCAYSATSNPPSAPSGVQTSFCFGPTLNLIWEESSTWDAFKVYKNGGLVATLTASDPDLGVSGPEYYYTVPSPITHATLGVSAVRSGAESPISYADGTYTC